MKLSPIFLLVFPPPILIAQFLHCSPVEIRLPQDSGIADITSGSERFKFKYSGVDPTFNAPNFVVVVPSSGTTPAGVRIGLNPAVVAELQPGGDRLLVQFTTMDVSPPSTTGCSVLLMVPKPPPPGIQSVLNAVSRQPFLSPLAQVSITGSNLTGPTRSTKYDATGFYPTTDAGTSVLFNGIPVPLLHLSPGKIKAIVPFALAGQSSVEVVGAVRPAAPLSRFLLQDTAPAGLHAGRAATALADIEDAPPIAPATSCAGGQFTTNGPDNPAPPGTTLKIFATGTGVWGRPSE